MLKNTNQFGIRFTLSYIVWQKSYKLVMWYDVLICCDEENRAKNIMQANEMLGQNSDSQVGIDCLDRIFRFKEL